MLTVFHAAILRAEGHAHAAERSRPYSARVRWKTVAAVVLLLLGVAIVGLTAPIIWLTMDETAVPPASDAPPLPEEVTTSHQDVSCGSGGCWREWTLHRSSSQSGTELVDSLDMPAESCSARSLLDRREVCAWLDVIDGEAHLFLQFDRPLD